MPLFYSPSSKFDQISPLYKGGLRGVNKHKQENTTNAPPQSSFPKREEKKNILIFGGSQGAQFINETFLANAAPLCGKYHITLISGLGKEINFQHKHFQQFPLLPVKELSEKIQSSDLIISRASSALFEIIAAKKPSIIIPLPSAAQNHQVKNAQYFKKKGLCKMLLQNKQMKDVFMKTIQETLNDSEIQANLEHSEIKNCAKEIAEKILN